MFGDLSGVPRGLLRSPAGGPHNFRHSIGRALWRRKRREGGGGEAGRGGQLISLGRTRGGNVNIRWGWGGGVPRRRHRAIPCFNCSVGLFPSIAVAVLPYQHELPILATRICWRIYSACGGARRSRQFMAGIAVFSDAMVGAFFPWGVFETRYFFRRDLWLALGVRWWFAL